VLVGLVSVVTILALAGRRATSDASGHAAELELACTDHGIEVGAPSVQMRWNGLHVTVRNDSDHDLLYVRDPGDIERNFAFDLVARGTQIERVLKGDEDWDPPGTWVAGCFSGYFSSPETPLSAYSVPFHVVDRDLTPAWIVAILLSTAVAGTAVHLARRRRRAPSLDAA
jgi:hypothetical protein